MGQTRNPGPPLVPGDGLESFLSDSNRHIPADSPKRVPKLMSSDADRPEWSLNSEPRSIQGCHHFALLGRPGRLSPDFGIVREDLVDQAQSGPRGPASASG